MKLTKIVPPPLLYLCRDPAFRIISIRTGAPQPQVEGKGLQAKLCKAKTSATFVVSRHVVSKCFP